MQLNYRIVLSPTTGVVVSLSFHISKLVVPLSQHYSEVVPTLMSCDLWSDSSLHFPYLALFAYVHAGLVSTLFLSLVSVKDISCSASHCKGN